MPWNQEQLDMLRGARTPVKRIELLCAQLNDLLNFEHTISPTLLAGLRSIDSNPQVRIKDLASSLGITARRFQSVFVQGLGTSPKRHAQSQRFSQVMEQIRHHSQRIDWTALALSQGFSDQSHLVHECQHVVGVTPSVLFRQVHLSDHPHHIALP